jgi:hypothetical protein
VSGDVLLHKQQNAPGSLSDEQKQQQQMAAILQLGRHQQQQQPEQQPQVVPGGCVAGVSDAMTALVLQLRSTGLLP